MGQVGKTFQVGVDVSADNFLDEYNRPSANTSVGLGVLTRWGRPDQWVNVVGGLRYIYGARLSGLQVPIMLNVNVLRGKRTSGYLGAGYEFDFLGTYWGCTKFHAGAALGRFDLRLSYKPYQGCLGAGITYYF